MPETGKCKKNQNVAKFSFFLAKRQFKKFFRKISFIEIKSSFRSKRGLSFAPRCRSSISTSRSSPSACRTNASITPPNHPFSPHFSPVFSLKQLPKTPNPLTISILPRFARFPNLKPTSLSPANFARKSHYRKSLCQETICFSTKLSKSPTYTIFFQTFGENKKNS